MVADIPLQDSHSGTPAVVVVVAGRLVAAHSLLVQCMSVPDLAVGTVPVVQPAAHANLVAW